MTTSDCTVCTTLHRKKAFVMRVVHSVQDVRAQNVILLFFNRSIDLYTSIKKYKYIENTMHTCTACTHSLKMPLSCGFLLCKVCKMCASCANERMK